MGKEIRYRVAVASSDGIVINQHFGRADLFAIYDIDLNDDITLVETRKVIPICQNGNHDNQEMEENIKCLSDCKYVLVSRIGQRARVLLEQDGIIPIEIPGFIEESIQKLIGYEKLHSLFE